ncbi:hypothetical protein AZF08_25665 [Bacillus gaemokensis]|nr:hypothetical protein AZF08_25665 [Bacillus gaemokensis]
MYPCKGHTKAPQEATWSALYLGMFPTVLSYILLGFLITHRGASESTSSLYLTPFLSFVIARVWLGETPTLMTIIGGIRVGVMLTTTIQPDTVKIKEKKQSFKLKKIFRESNMRKQRNYE